jgi:hypothetical protein
MQPLARQDLYSLERYAEERAAFRAQVLEHKRTRRLALGAHAALYFEDRLTIQYQVQEMLRTEKIFDRAGIQSELDAYNPLIPDGANWKATFMLEYPDPVERARELARLVGIEHRIWVQIGAANPVYAIADEDLDRSTDVKTSSVHFLRFELGPELAGAVKAGAAVRFACDHANLTVTALASPALRASLVSDLD